MAAGILVLALSGLYAASGRMVSVVRKSDEMADLQRNSAARLDQLRRLGWADVAKPSEIRDILATPLSGVAFEREVVSVYEVSTPMMAPTPSPTPSPTPAPRSTPLFTVTKTASGVTIDPANFDPETSLAMRQLNFRVRTEMRTSGKLRQRELSTVISRAARR